MATIPPILFLACGHYPERMGNASRVHSECIQSVTFLLERHSSWTVWNATPYNVKMGLILLFYPHTHDSFLYSHPRALPASIHLSCTFLGTHSIDGSVGGNCFFGIILNKPKKRNERLYLLWGSYCSDKIIQWHSHIRTSKGDY